MSVSPYIITFDFETVAKLSHTKGKLDAHTIEPAQLAAVAIDLASLEVVTWGGVFDSLMCPEGDWKDRLDPGALFVNKLNPDDIAKAPPRKEVWLAFSQWVKQFNPKGKGCTLAPYPAGKNIKNFDNLIVEDLSERYGTIDAKGLQTLFHRRRGSMWGRMFDLDDMLLHWFEGQGELDNYSMDTVREYFGLETEGGHSARVDTIQTAEMICRFLRLKRKIFKQVPFRNSMKDWKVPAC